MSVRLVSATRLRLRASGVVALTSGPASVPAPPTPTTGKDLNTGLAGQSNLVHLSDEFGDVHYYSTGPLAQRWTSSGLARIGWYDTTGHVGPGVPYSTFGTGPYAGSMVHNLRGGDGITNFVNQLTAATGASIVTYEYAVIGSDIASWIDNGSANNWKTYADAVRASGRTLNSAIWYQGENNSDLATSKAIYKAGLRAVHDQHLALAGLTRATAAQFYFGIVILGPGTTYAPEGRMGIIREAQLEYVNDPANVGAYLTACATDMNLAGGDVIHIDNPSEATLGLRYSKSLAAWANGSGVGAAGPKIISATRNALQVIVTAQHAGGTLLRDGAGGTGASALGFQFFDAGAAGATIAYTASSISSANTITLTLASLPVGALTMSHAMANAPYGSTTAPASVIYDNDIVPGSTRGLPLQPCAAFTVTGS